MRPAATEPSTPGPRHRERIRLGVSACLLGEEVRYDGGHKRDRFLTDVLAPYVQWVPVCPEVEVGLGEVIHARDGGQRVLDSRAVVAQPDVGHR